ncbi:MAG: hypothetical protein CGU28_02435 [Candidatus Dactylopiibacterium carminicum]|nr:MAG: hypothetical protein CGU28_02435 [Candidatus Dactylopiibacterium carminicum]
MSLEHEILDRLCEYLSRSLRVGGLKLAAASGDGRVDSQASEQEISKSLLNYAQANDWFSQTHGLSIEIAPARHWYDFCVRGPDFFLPVNVKVSVCKSSDNLSSKEGVFFALTGVDPKAVTINTWERFCERLAEYRGRDPRADYYFLVVHKERQNEVFWTSLKSIGQLDPNGNNPPFHCHWGKNRERVSRSTQEAEGYILGVLGETFRLRAEAWRSFRKAFHAQTVEDQ